MRTVFALLTPLVAWLAASGAVAANPPDIAQATQVVGKLPVNLAGAWFLYAQAEFPGGAAGPLRPQSYDGTVGPVTGAVSEVFSGPNSPIRDIGFVAITPNQPAVVVPAVTCTCTPVAGCPE